MCITSIDAAGQWVIISSPREARYGIMQPGKGHFSEPSACAGLQLLPIFLHRFSINLPFILLDRQPLHGTRAKQRSRSNSCSKVERRCERLVVRLSEPHQLLPRKPRLDLRSSRGDDCTRVNYQPRLLQLRLQTVQEQSLCRSGSNGSIP